MKTIIAAGIISLIAVNNNAVLAAVQAKDDKQPPEANRIAVPVEDPAIGPASKQPPTKQPPAPPATVKQTEEK